MSDGMVLLQANDDTWYLINVNLLHVAYTKNDSVVLEYQGEHGVYYIPCGTPEGAKGILESLYWGNERRTDESVS